MKNTLAGAIQVTSGIEITHTTPQISLGTRFDRTGMSDLTDKERGWKQGRMAVSHYA
jgi:hypothetical protein